MIICSISDCGKPARTRTWCNMHYARWLAHGDPLITKHRVNGELCAIGGCLKPAAKREWCHAHYQRWKKHGDPSIVKKRANGEGSISHGYLQVRSNGVNDREHVIVAERALGRKLPKGAVVHHVDEDRLNNTPANLVICPNRGYHALLHIRMAALAASGHADWRKCSCCKVYDDVKNLKVSPRSRGGAKFRHPICPSGQPSIGK